MTDAQQREAARCHSIFKERTNVLIKIEQRKTGNEKLKFYLLDDNESIRDIYLKILDSNYNFNWFQIEEDADIGMRTISGRYNRESFMKNFERIMDADEDTEIDAIIMDDNESIMICAKIGSDNIYLRTSFEDLELEDIIKVKKKSVCE